MAILERILQSLSGKNTYGVSKQLVFQKVIGVKGLSSGVGTSTIVQNLAYYYSKKKNMRVCVIDTSFLNPIQNVLLSATKSKRDLVEYSGIFDEISNCISKTKFKNVSLISLNDRTIVDMVEKDDKETALKLLQDLKILFDIIIIDLCEEPTKVNHHLAIRCNKIVSVADQSAKCVYHLKNTINRLGTLAIPLQKMELCLLNKEVEGVKTNTLTSLEEAGLKVFSSVPYNHEIARLGITGDTVLAFNGESKGYFTFEKTISALAEYLVSKTPLNAEYHNEEYRGKTVMDMLSTKSKGGPTSGKQKTKAKKSVKEVVEVPSFEEDDLLHQETLEEELDLVVEEIPLTPSVTQINENNKPLQFGGASIEDTPSYTLTKPEQTVIEPKPKEEENNSQEKTKDSSEFSLF